MAGMVTATQGHLRKRDNLLKQSAMTNTPTAVPMSRKANRPIAIWLFGMCALIVLMVVVGGATRLTDSGLSITEWKPVVGALPPLSHGDWLAEFEKYKQIPEYNEVNYGMSLADFKEIYWWEWGHRFLGRLIGIAFFIPFVFFLATGRVSRGLGIKLGGLFVLGGAQGFLGWYMVQSGLSERVDVSQYRLAAHLGLAVMLFMLMVWLALDLYRDSKDDERRHKPIGRELYVGSLLLVIGVYSQIILGAFVAGLRAGWTFNTWPLMDGRFFPAGYFSATPRMADLFESIAAVQFNHRVMAYILFAAAIGFYMQVRRTPLQREGLFLMAAVIVQALMGIATLVMQVPLWLGLLHQAGAMAVLFLALMLAHKAHCLYYGRGVNASRSSAGRNGVASVSA